MQYATAHFLRVARTECIGEEETSAQNQPRKFLVRLASREAALTVCETVLKHRRLLTHRGATLNPLLFLFLLLRHVRSNSLSHSISWRPM